MKMLMLANLKRMLNCFGGKKQRSLELVKGLETSLDKSEKLDAKTLLSLGNNHEYFNKVRVTTQQLDVFRHELVREYADLFRDQVLSEGLAEQKLMEYLDTCITKQRENHIREVRALKEELKEKEVYTDHMRRSFLQEIMHLRDKVYSKTNLGAFKNEDIFRFEAFKVDDVLDKPTVRLLNERLEKQRDFYLQR